MPHLFYLPFCFRPCSKPCLRPWLPLWHQCVLLQCLTDTHICHIPTALQRQTKTHFEAFIMEQTGFAHCQRQTRKNPDPPYNSQGKKGTRTLYNPVRLLDHSLILALPPRPSPACTSCSLPLRSWGLVLLTQGAKFPPPFPQVPEPLHARAACSLPLRPLSEEHWVSNCTLHTKADRVYCRVSSSNLIPDRPTAVGAEPQATLQQRLFSSRSHDERQGWSDPLSSPGRSTLPAGQPQFCIHLPGVLGGGGAESLPDVLKHLVKCLMGDSHPPTLCTLRCQLGGYPCKKPREMW